MSLTYQPWAELPVDLANPVNAAHPLNRERIAWYLAVPGRTGGRTWYDLMGRYDGTLTNMTSGSSGWGLTFRPGGWAQVNFDGTNDSVECAVILPSTGSALTIAGWCYRAATNVRCVFGWGHLNNLQTLVIWESDGNTYFEVDNNVSIYPNVAFAGTGWHHFLLSYDGTQATATNRVAGYIDGIPQTLTTGGTTPGTTYLINNVFRIGSGPASTRWTTGAHDDVSVWNRALSAAEARSVYDLSQRGWPGVLNRLDGLLWAQPAVAGKVPWHLFFPAARGA